MARKTTGGTQATLALDAARVAYSVHAYDHDPAEHHFGAETVAALGVEATRVCKTLIASCDGELVVAVIPVATQLDLKALAHAVGAKHAELADPKRAQRSSGYLVGGISPLGQKTALPTFLDESLAGYETILVSAGKRGMQVELSPADLVDLTGARTLRLGR